MEGGDAQLISLIVLVFLIFFPLLWIFIGVLLARISGWAQLSRYYETDMPVPENAIKFRSMAMGYTPIFRANYSNILNIGVDGIYLYLSVFPLFKIGHKPLCIPFDEMEIQDGMMVFIKTKRINTHKVPAVTIVMTARLVEKIDAMRTA